MTTRSSIRRHTILLGSLLLGITSIAGKALADGTEELGPPLITIRAGNQLQAAGTGTAQGSGVITIDIPSTATIRHVLLYWSGASSDGTAPATKDEATPGAAAPRKAERRHELDVAAAPVSAQPVQAAGLTPEIDWDGRIDAPLSVVPQMAILGDNVIVVNGIAVLGARIGGPTLFAGTQYNMSYRASITGLGLVRPGSNTLAITEMDFNMYNDGVGVLVIYNDGDESALIDLRDGNDSAFSWFTPPLDTTVPQTFTFAALPFERTAELTLFVGDVDAGRPTEIDLTVNGVTTTLFSPLGSFDGLEWDTLVIPVTIPAGVADVTVQVLSKGNAAQILPASVMWVMCALRLPLPQFDDCNKNGVPDMCDVDCTNGSGACGQLYPNTCGLSADCNNNNIPDSCELAGRDCNSNGILDDCELGGALCDDGDACTVDDVCVDGACVGEPRDCSALDDACLAGVCNPSTGACYAAPANDEATCDDGNPCTVEDFCSNGVCNGYLVDCSHLDSPCALGACNPDTGVCEESPINEGGDCNDDDACTEADVCSSGACRGTPIDCTAWDDACNLGTCDPTSGSCHATPAHENSTCDDGDGCTIDDRCINGVCQGEPKDCSSLDNGCNFGVCVGTTGVCAVEPAPDGTFCEDGDPCTEGDICSNGICLGWEKDCSALDDDCLVGVCSPATGACVAEPAPDGGACDDGAACTTNDVCSNGLCRGEDVDCSHLDGMCNLGVCDPVTGLCAPEPAFEGQGCDDGELCTDFDICSNGVCRGEDVDCTHLDDACHWGICIDSTGLCDVVPANDGGTCDDGEICTTADMCSNGTCRGTWRDCTTLDDACNIGVCDPLSGVCVAEPDNEGGFCDDGDDCTEGDTCVNGTCLGDRLDCSAWDDACNVGVCVGTSGVCAAEPANHGGGCDDDNRCTIDDLCSNGICVGTPVDCSHLDDACNLGVCDPVTGACTVAPRGDGAICDDGDGCTVDDRCLAGVCGGIAKDCSALDDACNAGVCIGTTGVCAAEPVNEGGACDDTNGCTLNDACSNGVCVGEVKDCSHLSDTCNAGVCVGTTGICVAMAANEGGICDDGDGCTIGDICESGACVADPLDCSALDDACNIGICVGTTGLCAAEPANEGGPCDDGDLCTINDACSTGVCLSAPLDCAYLDDACNVGVCDPATGQCITTPINDGGSCDDGDGCTVDDVCRAGVCGGAPKDCSGQDDTCNLGVCVGTTGICAAEPANEGGACDDGNACTIADTCAGGTCGGAPKDCSSFDDTCNLGVCVGTTGVCAAEPANNGGACNDGNGCTVDDVCADGVCGGAPLDCSGLDDACHVGVCIGTSGVCSAEPANDGGSCDDGDDCTVADTCSTGVCTGIAKDCSALDDACHIGVCIGTSGLCSAEPAHDGGGCDDGDGCTINDTCSNGTCHGVSMDCSLLDDACNLGVCVGTTGICAPVPANPGGSCDDGNACTVNDACSNGTCAGEPMDCSLLDDQCVVGMCDGQTGECIAVPAREGESCDDGDGCSVNDVCQAGACVGQTLDCSILDDTCNRGVCVGTSGVCSAEPFNEGGTCDDGDGCTVGDICSIGVCAGGPKDCSALDDACNIGTCVGTSGVCTATPANEGDTCDDGDICTLDDACSNGLCLGDLVDCTPLDDQCNVGACVAPGVCIALPVNDGGTCSDGLNCTVDDTCNNGACNGAPMVCIPGEFCDEDQGACVRPVIHRVGAGRKGSLLVFSKVEVRWNAAGELIQDTFLNLTNDYPDDVRVQMYFINGDAPLSASPPERAHPGWNWVDVQIFLTGHQPTYWSAHEGLPATGGVSPLAVLDPGTPPGRPDPERPGERVLRGYVLAWAVDTLGHEIRWNHLAGDAVLVDYDHGTAWEYGAFSFQVVDAAVGNGQPTGTPGELNLDGVEYDQCFDRLLLDFKAVDATVYARPEAPSVVNTHLTLHPMDIDVRQESAGPTTTKASFTVWNMNEVKLTGLDLCVTCWDQRLLSSYGVPNHFLRQNLQTDKGRAQIDGVASGLCHQDTDGDGAFDIFSVNAGLLGVAAEEITFLGEPESGSAPVRYASPGGNLHGIGTQNGLIRADVRSAPVPEKAEDQAD